MYKIICDRCGEEYGTKTEWDELDQHLYRMHRYVNGVDEYGDQKLRTICLCPKCEDNLDMWLGFKDEPSSLNILKDENFGLPRFRED